ncbi:MAG: alkaline phosphatase D family protein, partial [Candidatus Kapaibacterium sp.]
MLSHSLKRSTSPRILPTLAVLAVVAMSALHTPIRAQGTSPLQSGPMVGAVTMREATLWVQTTGPASVRFEYADITAPQRVYRTFIAYTAAASSFTAKCVADSVLPGRTYTYTLFIDEQRMSFTYPCTFTTPPQWQYRSDPPEFRIVAGSCAFINDSTYDRPGRPYGGEYRIFSSMSAKKANVMLWLGDNIYLRESDWTSVTGIRYRYTHSRSLPELQPLLASSVNYAIWDDHDFGPNDSDRGFFNKEATRAAFMDFWANPPCGLDGQGICSATQWGDVDIFLLDDRWWRSPNKRKDVSREMLGARQREWLIDNLASSSATFKLVCIGGQVLNSQAVYETYATYAEERALLLDAIRKEGITGVIFLTGDRHHTELSLLSDSSSAPVYDLTTSPLTSSPNPKGESEANALRVPGTFTGVRNFAVLDFLGAGKNRALRISTCDADGNELWQHTITAHSLRRGNR